MQPSPLLLLLLLLALPAAPFLPKPPSCRPPAELGAKRRPAAKSGKGFGAPVTAPPAASKKGPPAPPQPPSPPLSYSSAVSSALSQISSSPNLYSAPSPPTLQFFELLPALLDSRFPPLPRVAEFLRLHLLLSHASDPGEKAGLLPPEYKRSPRPLQDLHAFFPLPPPPPFLPNSAHPIAAALEAAAPIIRAEFAALRAHDPGAFRPLTNLNEGCGWSTLLTHENGARRPSFPYRLVPSTLALLESLPIAGRIAGFSRQAPLSGIPPHSDGNNAWLTVQLCLSCATAEGEVPYIENCGERRYYRPGEALLYDTTYEHHTRNPSPTEERVVLHVDFWNELEMTQGEIEACQYVYEMRGKFEAAEAG